MIRKSILLITLLLSLYRVYSQHSMGTTRPPRMPHGYLNETHLKIAYALGFVKLIDTHPDIPEDINEIRGITYKKVDTLQLKLDIYRKKTLQDPVPAIIFIHGGGWSKGTRSDYLPYLIDFAEKGFVTVTVSYRLSGIAHFPAAVEDVKCAVRWVRAHAGEYLIDPAKIALAGGSAGGHLAMMAGYSEDHEFSRGCDHTVSAKVQAIVDFYGPVDLTTPYAQKRHECLSFLGKTYEEDPDIYAAASPRFYVSADDPPTLIFHGTIDNLVPVRQADSLHIWLNRVRVINEYHKLKGWPHTMDLSLKVNRYCQYYMEKFLRQYLEFTK